jgi:hypothetical protein
MVAVRLPGGVMADAPEAALRFGVFRYHAAHHLLFGSDEIVPLPPKALDLLGFSSSATTDCRWNRTACDCLGPRFWPSPGLLPLDIPIWDSGP